MIYLARALWAVADGLGAVLRVVERAALWAFRRSERGEDA